MRFANLLIANALGGYVIQNGWSTNDCTSAPVSITIFNDSISTNLTLGADASSPIPVCGIMSADIFTGCCFQLHSIYSQIYNSFERHYLAVVSQKEYPTLANGNTYCHLQSLDKNPDFIEFNYLGNDQCIDDYFICTSDYLLIYQDPKCTGPSFNYSSSSDLVSIHGYGSYSLQFIKVLNGSIPVVWMTTLPYSNVPIHLNGYSYLEILAIIFAAIGTMGFVVTFVYYVKKYSIQKQFMNLWLVLTQGVWISRCIFTVVFVYYNPPTELDSDWITSVWCFSCACTYMSAMISANLTLKIFKIEHHRVKSGILYAVITAIALVSAWPSFLYFLSYIFPNNDSVQSFYFATSDELYFGWEIFMFAFDLVPPIAILRKMRSINVGKFKQHQKEAFIIWKQRVILMLAVESVNISIYICLFSLQYFSLFLGSDVGIDSVWLIQLLNYFIHNAIILSLFESLKEMVSVFVTKNHPPEKVIEQQEVSDTIQCSTTVRQQLNP
ncbi:hypothetical protein HDV04_003664 [Boothiomyces sp. JEL0838]|nr:hypothetical protein HDV04_003664 [Boothiomyces sp. JEL0838]